MFFCRCYKSGAITTITSNNNYRYHNSYVFHMRSLAVARFD